jgi:hypothetical protein
MRKETDAMQIIKSHLLLMLTALALVLVFGVTTSTAQETIKMTTKYYGVFTKMEQMNLDDTEGHTMSFYESKGAGTGSTEDFTFWSPGASDLIKGNGPHHGYFKATDKNGDVYFNKWQGKVTTTMSPQGTPMVKYEGTWSFIRGTGRWENAQGGGTYKGWFIGEGIYVNTTEGELTIN